MQTLTHRFTTLSLVGILALSVSVPALAEGPRGELRAEMSEKAGSRPGLLRDFTKRGRAAIGSCVLASKSTSSLTCTKDGKTYTVNFDSKTQLRRRFWGKATIEEMQVGDTLNVIGQWADDAHSVINAKLIRDASIQKRFGVFFGTVQSLMSSGWVMSTVNRGNQTVTVSGSTKFANRKEETIVKADIKVGDKVRVRGLWDRNANTITEVSHVKDFSLPLKPTPTP